MTTSGETEHCSGVDENSMKALWATIDGLEHRLDSFNRESQQCFDDLTGDMWLVLTEIRDGGSTERDDSRQWARDFPQNLALAYCVRNQRDMGQFQRFVDPENERCGY
ncbi:hypothetical protein TorRG33x02_065660 [Trema orientale]|uniref:Uncharacterized protein n=1 Tax=Trema orientale TaxID=63057 RepID=A0A2P5FIQ9_TREOI|nr:hypothetical protein TorRG33x02_065660 [Trema orientale]